VGGVRGEEAAAEEARCQASPAAAAGTGADEQQEAEDGAGGAWQMLPTMSSTRVLDPACSCTKAAYDGASKTAKSIARHIIDLNCAPSFLGFTGIL
jgi:hypothetical protein